MLDPEILNFCTHGHVLRATTQLRSFFVFSARYPEINFSGKKYQLGPQISGEKQTNENHHFERSFEVIYLHYLRPNI